MTLYTVEIKQIDQIEIDWHLQVEKRNLTLHCLAIYSFHFYDFTFKIHLCSLNDNSLLFFSVLYLNNVVVQNCLLYFYSKLKRKFWF